jgi:ATP-dependent helicase/nuclease subunit B
MENPILKAMEEGATVVTGGHHLARVLRQEYNALRKRRGDAAWPAPVALPWQGWMSSLWEDCQFKVENPPALLDPWQERALWHRAVLESEESSSLLQVGGAAATAQEAWSLAAEWRLDLRLVESAGNEDSRVFARWAQRFESLRQAARLIEAARLPDYLRSAIARLRLPARVILAGFDELTPQQRDFIEACRAAGCAITTAAREAGGQAGSAVRVAFADPGREIEAAARWARALLARKPDVRIGVVVPDLSGRGREVSRVFRNVLEPAAQLPGRPELPRLFHVSAGEPLSIRPLVASALSLLSLSPQRNEWDKISGLVLSPYVAGAVSERASRGLLDTRMRRTGEMQVAVAVLRRLCREAGCACPALDNILGKWMRLRDQAPATQSAAAWSRTFSALLESLGWPGEQPLTSVEYQTAEAWSRVLSQFDGTDGFAGALSMEEAVSLLGRIAAETVFQTEGKETPVKVLGILEASGLHFDHLWVAGLHDEAWSGPPKPNPFLPIRMQRGGGVPRCSPERELEFAALLTRRLLASAPDVVVSHPALVEDREVAPSPLILPVRRIHPEELALDNVTAYAESVRESRVMEQMVDEQGPPLGAEAWQRGGTKVFQYQSTCPFRAFAELRLGAEELDTPVPGLDLRRRGTLVHTALEEFWKEVRTQEALCTRADISEIVRNSARLAIARLEQDTGSAIPERFAGLERRRLERLVSAWLEVEKLRGHFEVTEPESERYADLGGIHARVKIDRIDRLPDGREIIIDYKTGRTAVGAWETERPDEPQLPLYSVIHDRPLAGVLFGQVNAGELRFRGWTAEPGLVPGADSTDLAAMVRDWHTVLERLAREFRTGRAAADPKDPGRNCRRCSLAALCRIAECCAPGDEEEAEA